MTFGELDQGVGALAAWLLAHGLDKGDRVASWVGKTRLACLIPLAAARAGLVHVPVNPLLKRGQVAHIVSDSGAKLLLTGAARAATIEPGDLPGDCALIDESEPELTGEGLVASDHSADDLAAILYTSGSTGRPKGVMLSHANMWLGAAGVAHYLEIKPRDRTLCLLPFAFDYGQNQLLSSWHAGASVVPFDFLLARDVIRAVERHDVTILAGVPPLWVQLTELNWPAESAARLRVLTNSGGKLPVPLIRALRTLFCDAALHSMYGLTEAFRSTTLDPALIDSHPESIGRAVPFAEILVVRPDGTETEPCEPGELVHAGPLVAQGYWNDPERTARRFRPAPASSRYGGTAVWSGDTAVRDADGLLRFVGRDDAMIKTSGNRVSPSEIEDAAVASGVVAEACAFGVPDARLGEAIMLIVRGNTDNKEEVLAQYLRSQLPNFMQPRAIVWREELPRNPNGKLDRVAIEAEFAA